MDENKPARRSFLRFGMRDVLWAMVVVGFALTWVVEHPDRWPMRWLAGPLLTKIYYVEDLAPALTVDNSSPIYGAFLVGELKASVTPTSWDSGRARVTAFETNRSLVVSHTPEGHKLVANYLAQARSSQGSAVPVEAPPSTKAAAGDK
jgi:hypothetical protein